MGPGRGRRAPRSRRVLPYDRASRIPDQRDDQNLAIGLILKFLPVRRAVVRLANRRTRAANAFRLVADRAQQRFGALSRAVRKDDALDASIEHFLYESG